MKEQARTFPLAEVHTRMGTEGEIILNQAFMALLGVRPGDWISFLIDEQGVVTVKGERTNPNVSAAPTEESVGMPHPDQVTQTPLFSAEEAW
jgi:hypothetical protein